MKTGKQITTVWTVAVVALAVAGPMVGTARAAQVDSTQRWDVVNNTRLHAESGEVIDVDPVLAPGWKFTENFATHAFANASRPYLHGPTEESFSLHNTRTSQGMAAWVTAEFLLAEAGGSGTEFALGANPLQIVTDIGNDWGGGYNAGVMVGDVVFTLTKPGTGDSGHTITKTDGTVLMPEAGLGFDMAPGRVTNSGSGYTDFTMTVSESGSDYVFEYILGPSHRPDGTPVHTDPLYTNTIRIAKTDAGPIDKIGFYGFAGDYNAQFATIHIVHTLTPSTFPLTIIPATSPATGYDLEWASQAGMLYNVWSTADLSEALVDWDLVEGDIPATGASTTWPVTPAGTKLFYRVEEFPPPPVTIFAENFDATAGPGLPPNWSTGRNNPPDDGTSTTNWEVGTPATVGPVPPVTPLPSGTRCVATGIASDYDDPATDNGTPHTDIWLRTAAIDLTGHLEGTLTFQQWTEIEDVAGDLDYGSIRILDASDNSELAVLEERTIDGATTGWEEYSKALPAAAFTATNGTIVIEFRFEADDLFSFAGWYIDDLVVTVPAASGNPYDTWAAGNGLTAANNAPGDDPDKDGETNLYEFAFDGDPLAISDKGKVFGLTEDSDFDGDTDPELLLAVAVRAGTPVFSGSPSPTATHDGITYTIEGSTILSSFPTPVNVVPTPLTTGLPAARAGYEYRSFSLAGSNGFPLIGFLRAQVTQP